MPNIEGKLYLPFHIFTVRYLALFDIDGTLIQGEHGHKKAFDDAFKEAYGIDVDYPWGEYNGYTSQMIIDAVLSKEGMSKKDIASGLKAFMAAEAKSFKKSLERSSIMPIPGVPKLLEELRDRGVKLGLVTGNSKSISRAKLTKAGIWNYFSIGGFGEDHKDRAELVRIALSRSDCEKSATSLIGDTKHDIRAGRDAGVRTIAMLTGGIPEHDLRREGCDFIFKDYSDTKAIVDAIMGMARPSR